MNRPNITALGLLVAAQTFLLFGLVFALVPLLKNPMGILEQESPFLGPRIQVPPLYEHIAENMPWLLSLMILMMFAVPAVFLFLGSLSIWRFLGRPRWLADKGDALLQKDMESLFQDLLTEIVESVARQEGATREILYAGMAKIGHRLDPRRQYRFFRFLQESGLDEAGITTPATFASPARLSHQQRGLLARAIALGLFLVSAFISLWGLLALIFQPQMQFMKTALGIEMDRVDAMTEVAFCFIVAGIPFTSGLGLLWLSHFDARLRAFRELGLGQARSAMVEGFRRQMLALFEIPTEASFRVGRALTSCAFLELDAPGKRKVIECLSELNLTTRAEMLDAGVANLSGVDLSEMDLSGSQLQSFHLNGARLCGTNLTSANLSGASLYSADLRHAVLDGACLRGADLRSARLHSAQLRAADLSLAHLEGANLWQADLMDADLTDCRIDAAQLAAALPRGSGRDLEIEHA